MAELWLSTRVESPEDEDSRGLSFTVVSVGGDLDLTSVPILREHLLIVLSRLGPCIALDLHDLTFMDSSGLALLVRYWKLASAAGGTLRLVAPPRHVVRKLTTTGLAERLRVYPGVTEMMQVPLGRREG